MAGTKNLEATSEGRGESPKEKSKLSHFKSTPKVTICKLLRTAAPSARKTSSGSSWPPPPLPLKKRQPTSHMLLPFHLLPMMYSFLYSSPNRTNLVQWRCANCLIKGISCIRVIWIKKVAKCEASDKRPRGRQRTQQWFEHKGISSLLFSGTTTAGSGFRNALSICDTPAFPDRLGSPRSILPTQLGRWAQRLAIPSLEVHFGSLCDVIARRKKTEISTKQLPVWRRKCDSQLTWRNELDHLDFEDEDLGEDKARLLLGNRLGSSAWTRGVLL